MQAGVLKLVGTSRKRIVEAASQLLDDPAEYQRMADAKNPYGDGHATERILDAILYSFGERKERKRSLK